MDLDPLGYYADLGVSHTASLEEIRAVYRALAKIYHPDVNSDLAAVDKFRRITAAYETIGTSARRSAYDLTANTQKGKKSEVRSQMRREAVEPIKCSQCGKLTAQPRFLVFRQVTSYVFVTHTSPKPGIYCSDCAVKQGFKSSAISAVFGWWGFPWGPIYTIREIVRNAFGGERNVNIDEQLMWQNAVAFMDAGKYDLAGSLALQLKTASNSEIASSARELLEMFAIKKQKIGRLKSPWRRGVGSVLGQLLIGSVVPAVVFMYTMEPFGIAKNSLQYGQSPTNVSAQPPKAAVVVPPVNLCVFLPANGQVLQQKVQLVENGHRLTIINGSSSAAIAKLRFGDNGNLAASFYIEKDQAASFDNIPDGGYIVQFAYGEAMNKSCDSFIEKRASKFDGVQYLRTEVTATQIITQELSFTLYTTPAGNVRPVGISESDFDAP